MGMHVVGKVAEPRTAIMDDMPCISSHTNMKNVSKLKLYFILFQIPANFKFIGPPL